MLLYKYYIIIYINYRVFVPKSKNTVFFNKEHNRFGDMIAK